MRYLIALLVLFALPAFAEPGTYTITPTELTDDGSQGVADGYNIYQGCDLATQSVSEQVAADAQVDTDYSFAGDSDSPPVVCNVPFNAAGEAGDGGGQRFTNTVTLAATQQTPGPGSIQLNCSFEADTGEVYDCTVQVDAG